MPHQIDARRSKESFHLLPRKDDAEDVFEALVIVISSSRASLTLSRTVVFRGGMIDYDNNKQ